MARQLPRRYSSCLAVCTSSRLTWAAVCLVVASVASRRRGDIERRAAGSPSAFSTDELVESRHLAGASRSVVGELHLVHRHHAPPASRLRRRGSPGSVADLRLPVRRRGWHAAEEGRRVQLRRRERRRQSHHRAEPSVLSDSRRGDHAGALDRRRRARQRRPRSNSDRHLLIVDRDNRHLYELYNVFFDGAQWHARIGRVLRPEHRTGGGPTAGRRPTPRGWRSCRASCATTRCSAPARSSTRSA